MRRFRHQMSPEARAGTSVALAAIALVCVIEAADGPAAHVVGFLAIAPFLAAAFAPWRLVVGVGVLATGLTTFFLARDPGGFEITGVVRLGLMVAATAGAVAVSMIRQRQNERFAELARLATVAQEAVLRPIGPQIGQLAVAGRYVSASAAADIGGDLYEALDTPYGVRMLIGDVRGKGIDAVRLASIVLGSYRHVAYERADLRTIVVDLDRAVARSVD